jgi:hypothetical protein
MGIAACVLGILVVAGVTVVVGLSSANRSLAHNLRQQGVRALAAHDYQSSEALLAASLEHESSAETLGYLLEARAGGVVEIPAHDVQGAVIAISGRGLCLCFR